MESKTALALSWISILLVIIIPVFILCCCCVKNKVLKLFGCTINFRKIFKLKTCCTDTIPISDIGQVN